MHLNNANGKAAMGYSTVSIDGAVPAALSAQSAGAPGGPSWLSTTKVAYQNYTSTAIVESYDTGTLARATLSSSGANTVAAGNSIWGSGLASTPSAVRSNVSGHTGPISGAMLGDVSDTGQLAVVTAYPSLVGLTVYSSAGATLLSLPDVQLQQPNPGYLVRIRQNLMLYLDLTAGWTMANVVGGAFSFAPRINEPIAWAVPVTTASGTTFVVEVSNRITVRYANKSAGWQIKPTGTLTFNPDIIELSAGVLRIGWSGNSAESATALNMLDLTIATGATVNWTAPAGSLVSAPGPTLTPTTFEVGPLQGSQGSTGLYPPLQDPMINPETGGPWTAHTTNLVPCIICDPTGQLNQLGKIKLREKGILADIAPTILDIMGLEKPKEMTGISLIRRG